MAAAARWFPDGDAVADDELAGSDEDVLNDGAQHVLAVAGGGGGGGLAEPGEEAFEAVGEFEVGVAVGGWVSSAAIWSFRPVSQARRAGMRARSSSMVMSCSENAVTIELIDVVVLARACSRWLLLRVTGWEVRPARVCCDFGADEDGVGQMHPCSAGLTRCREPKWKA